MQPIGPSTETVKQLVCRDCDWETARIDAERRESVDRAAIDHYATTGHCVEASITSRSSGSDAALRDPSSTAARGPSDD